MIRSSSERRRRETEQLRPEQIIVPRQFRNPFYVLLLVAGFAFLLTTTSYAVATVQGLGTGGQEISPSAAGFARIVDAYGFTALMGELVILAIGTIAAIATDEYWLKQRAVAEEDRSACPQGDADEG